MRLLTVGEMLARDLLRRRVALGLLIALPLAFYSATRSSSDDLALTAGGIGLAWSVAGAALFCSLAAREVDQRLVLDGFRPWELLTGRLAMLTAFALPLAAGFGLLMVTVSDPPDQPAVILALALVVAGAVPFGLAVAAVVPRELEGTLVLIGVIGIQMSVSSTSDLVGALPFGAAQRLLDQPAPVPIARWAAVVHGLGWAAVLVAVVMFAWRRRVLVGRRSPRRTTTVAVTAVAVAAVLALALPWPAVSETDPAVVSVIPVGHGPFGVTDGPSGVWVSNFNDGTVTRIDPATDSVIATIAVGHHPTGLIEAFGTVWVTNTLDGTVTRIDPATNKVIDTTVVGGDPHQLVALDGSVWVVNNASNDVARVDSTTGQVTARVRVGLHPSAIFTAAGSLWIGNYGDRSVTRVDPATNTATATITLPDPPQSIAGTDSHIILTTGDRRTLVFIDPDTNLVSRIKSYTQASLVLDAATTPNGTTWVTIQPSMLIRLDTTGTDTVVRLGDARPTAIAATARAIWVTDPFHDRVLRINPNRIPR